MWARICEFREKTLDPLAEGGNIALVACENDADREMRLVAGVAGDGA